MAKRFWYTISLYALAGWLRRTKCQITMMKNYDEDISYSYYVMESKRLLQELM